MENRKCKSKKNLGNGCPNPRCPDRKPPTPKGLPTSLPKGKGLPTRPNALPTSLPKGKGLPTRPNALPTSLPKGKGLPTRPNALPTSLPKGKGLPTRPNALPTNSQRNENDMERIKRELEAAKTAQLEKVLNRIKEAENNPESLPSYASVAEMESNLMAQGGHLFTVTLYGNLDPKYKYVDIDIAIKDPSHRGKGLGTYIRKVVNNFADRNGYVVSGTPTGEGENGLLEASTEQQRSDHRNRLIASYMKRNYEYNYASDASEIKNDEWVGQFNPEALEVLREAGEYVRFPNLQIPDEWKS